MKRLKNEKALSNLMNDNDDKLKDLSHYKYLVIGRDKMLSGWGKAQDKNAYTYLLVDQDAVKLHQVLENFKRDGFVNVNYYFLNSDIIPIMDGVSSVRFIENSPLWNK